MKNTKKKGFTLVELLVVIAIIAILAGVSIVGYLGFTEKAKESNAINEMAQYKTYILAELADGEEVEGNVKFTYVDGEMFVEATEDAVQDVTPALKALLNNNEIVIATNVEQTQATKNTTTQITAINYTSNGYVATWTIGQDKITAEKAQ